jgi:hypothetical protein
VQPNGADLRWAAEQAPRVLAQARAEALQEARAQLREMLVDALISAAMPRGAQPPSPRARGEPAPTHARAEPAAPARREPPPSAAPEPTAPARVREQPAEAARPSPAAAADGLGLWVYGVLRGDAPDLPGCAGVDGRHDVELIRHAGLAAVASAVPLEEFRKEALEEQFEDLDRLAALARTHERVLDEALRLGPVVPTRIATIYESAGRVREMLAREQRSLDDTLKRLTGAAEWGVKAYLGARREAREPVAAGAPASGMDYLAQKRERRDAIDAAARAVDASLAQIHGRLSEQALDAVYCPAQDPRLSGDEREMILNAAYLVPNARVEDFRSLVGALGRRHAQEGIALELSGPWPAYHFAASATLP